MTSHPVRPGFAAPEVASRADVLRRLDLAVTRRLDGRMSGDHATTHLGPGSERAGARAYEPGDDARLIDWNLTARAGETFVRRTEAVKVGLPLDEATEMGPLISEAQRATVRGYVESGTAALCQQVCASFADVLAFIDGH